ncbi:DUF4350 domain-containing protein [Erythrobacteraceae bacterium E2-1 Yellow Sea]|nr:DUF4350 domain-containing protein [Erythrobacteraceae bacterium E2-1 Yellow Sea]
MSARASSPFTARTVLLIVLFGALAFLALLYAIGAGETGSRGNDGRAHAAANGLNGYAGLAKLLELEGYDVTLSRSKGQYTTASLLVLTPPQYMDAEEFAEILEKRQYLGPTLVILPKWYAANFPQKLPDSVKDKVKKGWVRLMGTSPPTWTADLPEPYGFESAERNDRSIELSWRGMGLTGSLPDSHSVAAKPNIAQDVLVEAEDGGVLALDVLGEDGSDFYENAWNTTFIVEPDLVNNYGLADESRAALALELVRTAAYDDDLPIVFDLTLNGFGGTTNLLTLAFQPPFLAATLCLILALLVIGWRAFRRFGAAAAEGPAIAYGKRQLVTNGAGLILRARRFRLLAEPYIALCARRLAHHLGLVRPDPAAINAALAMRLPDELPFTHRAEALRHAHRQSDILCAADALKELERKLTT